MTTYYVRPTNGSDAAAGTSFANAWQTTQHAFDNVAAGDEIRLCAEATESVGTKIDYDTTAGTAASPILITGANGSDGSVDGTRYTLQASASITYIVETAPATALHLKFQHIVFDGNANATYCVGTGSFNSVLDDQVQYFYNCRFTNATSGLRNRNSAGLELVDCEIDNHSSNGFEGFFAPGYRMAVGCYVHDNGGHGFHQENGGSGSGHIVNCIFDTNTGSGLNIEVAAAPNGVFILNSVFYNNVDGISFSTNSLDGGFIANNVFMDNSAYGIDWGSQSKGALFVDYNCYYNNTTNPTSDGATAPGSNNVTSDPSFANAAGGDFTPGSSSPLIQAGVNGANIGAVAHAAGGGGAGVYINASSHHLRR